MFIAPPERWHHRAREARWNAGAVFTSRDIDGVSTVFFWIHDHQGTMAGRHRVNGAATIYRWMVLVGRCFIMHERMVVTDIPKRRNNVALNSLGPLGRRRNFALRDPIRPI